MPIRSKRGRAGVLHGLAEKVVGRQVKGDHGGAGLVSGGAASARKRAAARGHYGRRRSRLHGAHGHGECLRAHPLHI